MAPLRTDERRTHDPRTRSPLRPGEDVLKSLLTALIRLAAALERLGEGAGPRRLWTQDDVAALFAYQGKDWWFRHKDALMTKHGFPAPVAGCGDRWDPAAILSWQDRNLPDDLRPAPPPAPPEDEEAGAEERLAQRAAGIVARTMREATGRPGIRLLTPAGPKAPH